MMYYKGGHEPDYGSNSGNEDVKSEVPPSKKYSNSGSTYSNRLSRTAQTFAFEFSKMCVYMKEGFSRNATKIKVRSYGREAIQNGLNEGFLQADLSCELSSLPLRPMVTLHHSTSALLFDCFHDCYDSYNLLDLDDKTLLRITRFLNGESVHQLSQTCQRIRSHLMKHADDLPKRMAYSYEISVSFNKEKGRPDVRALRRNRSFKDEVYEADNIEEVIPRLLCCVGKVILGVGVNVKQYSSKLLRLYGIGRLRPLAIVFGGGEHSQGYHWTGADLRGFSEPQFIEFVRKFYPHLQEIQLQTGRLFKTSSASPRLLSLISEVSCLGITYERPALRYRFEDVKRVVAFWRHNPLSRSCTVYMRRPTSATIEGWRDMGGVLKNDSEPITEVNIVHFHIPTVNLHFILH